jgi:hypothetical protein
LGEDLEDCLTFVLGSASYSLRHRGATFPETLTWSFEDQVERW